MLLSICHLYTIISVGCWAVCLTCLYYLKICWQAGSSHSDVLRVVQFFVIEQDICAERYTALSFALTENMVCTGWLDVGVRAQCEVKFCFICFPLFTAARLKFFADNAGLCLKVTYNCNNRLSVKLILYQHFSKYSGFTALLRTA